MSSLQRILIIGNPGAGKNWLGERLAQKYHLPFKDLDDFKFIRKYDKKRESKDSKKLLTTYVKRKNWVCVGIPYDWIDPAQTRATLIIIMRRSLIVEGWRILKRYLRRSGKHKESLRSVYGLIRWDWRHCHKKQGFAKLHYAGIKHRFAKKVVDLNSRSAVAHFARTHHLLN